MENERPRNKSSNIFFWKKEQKTKQSFKYVKDEGSRDSHLQILHVSNVEDETQTDGKNFCLLPLKNQRKTSSFVLLAFLVLLSPASLFSSLFFFHSDERIKEKKTSMFPCYLCFHSLPLLRFSFLSLAVFSAFFSLFFLLFCCSPFFFSALFLLPLARSLEGFIYSLEYLYLGKI